MLRNFSRKDALTALLLLGCAGYFATSALRHLKIGTPNAMGPGFFPLMISAALGILAILIGIRAFRSGMRIGAVAPFRAFLFILVPPVLFGLLIVPAGFVPSIALATFVACWSSRLMAVNFALMVTGILTALSTTVFVYLLQMPVTLFGSVVGF